MHNSLALASIGPVRLVGGGFFFCAITPMVVFRVDCAAFGALAMSIT